jgi:hypothetical protein
MKMECFGGECKIEVQERNRGGGGGETLIVR